MHADIKMTLTASGYHLTLDAKSRSTWYHAAKIVADGRREDIARLNGRDYHYSGGASTSYADRIFDMFHGLWLSYGAVWEKAARVNRGAYYARVKLDRALNVECIREGDYSHA